MKVIQIGCKIAEDVFSQCRYPHTTSKRSHQTFRCVVWYGNWFYAKNDFKEKAYSTKLMTRPKQPLQKLRFCSENIIIDGIKITLMPPVKTDDEWIDYGQYLQQLEAAWLTLS